MEQNKKPSHINVCHIISRLDVGGAERMLLKIINETNSLNVRSFVLSIKKHGPLEKVFKEYGVPVIHLPLNPFLLSRLIPFKPNILQGWMYYGNLFSLILKPFLNSKSSISWNIRQSLATLKRDKLTTRISIYLNSLFSFLPKKIIFNSFTAQTDHENIHFKKSKSIVLPNGFNTEEFKPSEKIRKIIRTKIDLAEDQILISSVGRMHPDKDYNTFIEAANHLLNNHKNVFFLLIGKDLTSSNDTLMKWIEPSKRKHFILKGPQKNITDYLCASDIYTSSSIAESFSNSIGEAMSCQVPCVATNVGDSKKIIADTGIIIQRVDPLALSNAWQDLINNKNKRLELGKKSRKRIQEEYQIGHVARQYSELYNSFLNFTK